MDALRIEAVAARTATVAGGDAAALAEQVQQLARGGDVEAARQFLREHPEQKDALQSALLKTDPGMIHQLEGPGPAPALSDRLSGAQRALDQLSGRDAVTQADQWASGAINGIRSDTPVLSQGASVLRGVLGFGKDLLVGAGSMAAEISPAGMASSALGDAATAARLAEGKTTPQQLAQQQWDQVRAIPGALVKPVTDAWQRGDYVEAGTRGVLEVGSLLLPLADAGKAAEAAHAVEATRATEPLRVVRGAEVLDGGRAAADAAGAERKVIEFEPGGKGSWNKELNKPLASNAEYVDRGTGYRYLTDGQGRVTEADGKLVLKSGERNGYQQSHAGGADRLASDDGGHLIATIFKGPGERLNLVPMDSNLNRGAWKAMENSWSEALSQGKEVSVQIKPHYDGTSLRPDSFEVRYTIGGGRPQYETFLNRPGGR